MSRSRIANLLAVASAIYSWAARPTRRLVSRNPVRLVELPPRDEKPRTRVASVAEAERLLDALRPGDAVPYAVARYTVKEIMVFMDHADLQTVDRYIKLLPQHDDSKPVDRLDSYLRVTLV